MYETVCRTIRTLVVAVSLLASASAFAEEPIQIPREVPYRDITVVPTNVASECTALGEKFGTSLQEFTAKYGVDTVAVDEVDPSAPGRVLVVEITNVYSGGNAFIGHRKSMSAVGELFVDGQSQGQANFTRNSSGGFGAGFKGSCSVLGRCSRTLGNDFAKWLRDQNDSH